MKNISKLLVALLLFASCISTQTSSSTNTLTTPVIESSESPQNSEESNRFTETVITTEEVKTIAKNEHSLEENEVQPKIEKLVEKPVEAFDHSMWHELLQAYVSEQGNVNYKAFKANRQPLNNYIKSLAQKMPDDTWTKNDVLAYWINAYNALTVDLIIRNYPLESIKDIKNPWDQRLWKLGKKWYNLDEIEHQILRKMDEPRIHFAIVCASFSCPKLQNYAFTAENLEEQLTESTKTFLGDPKRNRITENRLELSKIFQWFTKDFKKNGSLVDFINTYTDIEIDSNAKTRYLDYNWDLND